MNELLFVLAFVLAATPSYAEKQLAQLDDRSRTNVTLAAILPSPEGNSVFPNCQPLNILLDGSDDSDGIARVQVDVVSNPPGHQRVLLADFDEAALVTQVQTRVRLAKSGEAIVKVAVRTRSGKQLDATAKILLREGVDFSDEESLTRRLPFNKGPIGTARARLSKETAQARKLQAILFHPMLPAIGGKSPKLIMSLHVQYRDYTLATLYFGPAMSNDPYIRLDFKEDRVGTGSIRTRWYEDTGNVFEPETISVK